MNLLDKAILYFDPRRAASRAVARRVALSYDAARVDRRSDGWVTAGTGPNAEISHGIRFARDRSRDLVRNNAYAVKALNVLVYNTIGYGITPRAKTGNPKLDARLDEIFAQWESECDAENDLDFSGLQILALRSIYESGDVLVRKRNRLPSDGLTVPLQLQILENDYIDSIKTGELQGGNYVINGVEFNKLGRVENYWIYDRHPGEMYPLTLPSYGASHPVSSKDLLLPFEKMRPGQFRGFPRLAPVVMLARDIQDFREAEIMRKKTEACFVGAVTSPEGIDGDLLGGARGKDENSRSLEQFEPGMVAYLRSGEDIKFGTPAAIGGYGEFLRACYQEFAAGCGCTYEQLTGDLSNCTYSSYRAGALEFRRQIEAFRWSVVVNGICNPVWRWFVDAARAAGKISDINYGVEWTAPRWDAIDPLKDGMAARAAIRDGRLTWPQAVAEAGYDPKAQLEEIAKWAGEFDRLGVILDCDPRRTNDKGAEQASAASAANGGNNG